MVGALHRLNAKKSFVSCIIARYHQSVKTPEMVWKMKKAKKMPCELNKTRANGIKVPNKCKMLIQKKSLDQQRVASLAQNW